MFIVLLHEVTQPPKTELGKIENLVKGWANFQFSQAQNKVSQGLEFLKVSIKTHLLFLKWQVEKIILSPFAIVLKDPSRLYTYFGIRGYQVQAVWEKEKN